MIGHMPWRVRLICCGHDDGEQLCETFEEADAFREAYCSGPGVGSDGHDRAGIVERILRTPETPASENLEKP